MTYFSVNVQYVSPCNFYMLLYSFFLFVERDARYKKWKMAVQRSLGWAAGKMSHQMTGKCKIIKQAKPSEMSGVIEAALYKYSTLSI